ncbi:hypothetical protein [Sphingobacterium sp. JB170]|uniref:hypothetical protein n=1 Tax=Sphingobacterium sp. JB170 TaxID=1434842 RepID=UPI000B34E256|nr:hypothetical protein [Sphingobacterium sp. JB170]
MIRFRQKMMVILLILTSQLAVNCSSDDDLINDGIENSTVWMDDLESSLGKGTKAKLMEWIGAGLDKTKLKEAFSTTSDKADLMEDLENSVSIYHQRVYVKDWDNIPGIEKSDYAPNGLIAGESNPEWSSPDLDLPAVEAANFVDATPVSLPEGSKIYRITGGNPAGGYWTIEKPGSIGDVIGGTAVQPAWNNFSKFYEYQVPKAQTLNVWQGTTARQPIAEGIVNPHLPGGEQQIFVPLVLRDDAFKKLVTEIPLPW